MIWQRECFDLISQERPLQMKFQRGGWRPLTSSVKSKDYLLASPPPPYTLLPAQTPRLSQKGWKDPSQKMTGEEYICVEGVGSGLFRNRAMAGMTSQALERL